MGAPLAEGPFDGARMRRRAARRRAFAVIAAVILAIGAVLLSIALLPSLWGIHAHPYLDPFAGGFLGLFLILWGVLLLTRIAFWSARAGGYGRGGGRRWDPAIAQARQRYARGEITREQFLQIVQDLRPPGGPRP